MKKALSLMLVFALVTLFPAASGLRAQEQKKAVSDPGDKAITNADVLEMIKSGLSTEIIVAKIRTTHSAFDTTPATLTDLKTKGVADAIIVAMVNASTSVPVATEAAVKVQDGTEIEI